MSHPEILLPPVALPRSQDRPTSLSKKWSHLQQRLMGQACNISQGSLDG